MNYPAHDPAGFGLPPAPAAPRSPLRWILGGALVICIGGTALYFRHGEHAAKEGGGAPGAAPSGSAAAMARAVSVSVAVAEQRDVPIYIEGLGNAVPLQQVSVHAQVDGRLDSVSFVEGQSVKKGDLLAELDVRPFRIALHQAQAALARDAAQLRNARINYDRQKNANQQGIASTQQVDDARALADQFVGTVAGDAAMVESAKLNVDYSRIVAPFDGVTGIRLVDPGNLVHQTDANGIVVITQLDPISIVFSLPQDDLPRVNAALAAGEVPVDAYGRDGVDKLGVGKLALVDNQISATTATMKLKATLQNPDRKLWPNQFVKARILVSTATGAIVIPSVAVQRGPAGLFVFVVVGDKVEQRAVEIQTTAGDDSLIKKGVVPGDKVVTDGASQLRPGSKVSVKKPGGDGPKGAGSAAPAVSGAPAASGHKGHGAAP